MTGSADSLRITCHFESLLHRFTIHHIRLKSILNHINFCKQLFIIIIHRNRSTGRRILTQILLLLQQILISTSLLLLLLLTFPLKTHIGTQLGTKLFLLLLLLTIPIPIRFHLQTLLQRLCQLLLTTANFHIRRFHQRQQPIRIRIGTETHMWYRTLWMLTPIPTVTTTTGMHNGRQDHQTGRYQRLLPTTIVTKESPTEPTVMPSIGG
mmetsp:Transcript_9076/g.11713  ORF Transcript_9076/g.11713 Transcript_9076/m.11713 type:complete len:209 (+) Transcript_9076:1433-2059(+)